MNEQLSFDFSCKPTVVMRNWTIARFGGRPHLYGDVYDHPLLGAKNGVTTTQILHYDREEGIAETRNTIYQLIGPGKYLLEEGQEI